MDCKTINELLTAYLDGEVTAKERSQIEAHLTTCQKCREELRALETTREGLRQALKMKAADIEPSPQAWNKIRQRISEASFWEKLAGLFNRPVWRAAIPVILVLIIIGALWRTGVLPGLQDGALFPTPTPAPTTTVPRPTTVPTITPPVTLTQPPAPTTTLTPTPVPTPRPTPVPVLWVTAVPQEAYYLPGGPVEVEFSITNISANPVTLDPYPPEIQIEPHLRYGQVLFSKVGGTQSIDIKPGETTTLKFTWNQKDKEGKQVSPGWYTVMLKSEKIGNARAWIQIRYPQGALEKTIEVNQSQTINDITITLDRVVLTAKEMTVYAHGTLPYTPPADKHPSMTGFAEYRIDGGEIKPLYNSGFSYLESGSKFVWGGVRPGIVDPVPSDAKELVFSISNIRLSFNPEEIAQGPWEFKVPLQ